ncbi:MAG: toast rack family protein [Cyclobacteriaceae bacterium]
MKRFFFFTTASILLLLTACEIRTGSGESGEVRQISQTIPLDKAESVRTDISMRAGRLMVKGGAKNLLDTEIRFSREEWEPEIEYTSSGETGRLRIDQPEVSGINLNFNNNFVNDWTILLNDEVVQDLDVEIGAGETELDLRNLQLRSVDIDAGVGEHSINLSDTSVPQLRLNAGVGEVSVDLSGTWNNDLEAEFNGGIGELNLLLPADIGIRMEISGALGSINAPGLNKDGNIYTNELYGQSDHVMELEVKAGIGEINVNVE